MASGLSDERVLRKLLEQKMRRRRALPLVFAVLVTLLCLLVTGPLVSAHLPIYDSGGSSMGTALQIPNPDTSYATYAEFEAEPNQIHFYSISVGQNQEQYLEILVPSLDSMRNFTPILLLIGPGLEAPNAETSVLLDFYDIDLDAGTGAVSWEYDGPLDIEEFEPFTQVVLLKRQSVTVTLPDEGIYFIAVAMTPLDIDPNEMYRFTTTKYILVTGVLEEFSIIDFVVIPYDWIRGHLFWDENPAIFLLPTYAVLIGGVASTEYVRRSRSPSSAVGSSRTEQAVFYSALSGGFLMVGGCVNQLLFLLSNPLFDLGTGETIVIMLQGIGIVLGVVVIRQSFSVLKPARWIRLVLAIVVAFAALMVGSGYIIGPLLFLAAVTVGFYLGRPRPQPLD